MVIGHSMPNKVRYQARHGSYPELDKISFNIYRSIKQNGMWLR
jgi:hypothetical protein